LLIAFFHVFKYIIEPCLDTIFSSFYLFPHTHPILNINPNPHTIPKQPYTHHRNLSD
jgi:hypothetical protein